MRTAVSQPSRIGTSFRLRIGSTATVQAPSPAAFSLGVSIQMLRYFSIAAGVVAAIAVATLPLIAQNPDSTPRTNAAASSGQKVLHPRARRGAAHPLPPVAAAAPAPVTPPAPALPLWPVNDPPEQPSVVWDSNGLRIDARNSSLQQILHDFSSASGATIEGMASDERVFGTYGPGQARDVLSQLLQGSGYNVLMIGDQGQGAPRQIVLSIRHAGDAQPASANNAPSNNDDDADVEEPAPPPQPVPMPFRPGFQPRAPQQLNPQELQQRQMQQRDLQIQQRNGQPAQNPNQPVQNP